MSASRSQRYWNRCDRNLGHRRHNPTPIYQTDAFLNRVTSYEDVRAQEIREELECLLSGMRCERIPVVIYADTLNLSIR